ncbi:MAG: DUF2207 family protein [Chloroflexota bacterium]
MGIRLNLTRVAAILALVTVLTAALTAPAVATSASAARRFRWEHLNVDIEVQPDGSAIITEEQRIAFEGPYSFVNRVIPLRRLQGISDIAVGDENGWYREGIDPGYRPVEFAGYKPQGQPGRFTVRRSGGEVTITWYFIAISETRTFRLRYRVAGVVFMRGDSDEIWWAAIGPDRGAEVRQARATIRLPERVPADSLVATAYEDERRLSGAAVITDYGADYEYLKPIPEDESWTVRLAFPRGIVAAVPPIPFRSYAAPLLISIVLAAVATLRFVRTLRSARIQLEPLSHDYTQPPADIPPGLVAYLFNPFATTAGAATFLDLAARGYYTVNRVQVGRSALRGRVQYEIEDTGKDRTGLLGYERSLLAALLADTPFTPQELQSLLTAINRDRGLSREADRLGWFATPQETPLRALPVVGGALGAIAATVGLTIWSALVGPEWLVAVPIVAGTATMVLQILRPMLAYMRPTEAGARARQQWGSFFRLLRQPAELIASSPDRALSWLPYAVAAGSAHGWQRALRNSSIAAPAWYHSEGNGVQLTDLMMSDFARDMLWVGVYGSGGGAGGGGGGVGGASGGGGGTAG